VCVCVKYVLSRIFNYKHVSVAFAIIIRVDLQNGLKRVGDNNNKTCFGIIIIIIIIIIIRYVCLLSQNFSSWYFS